VQHPHEEDPRFSMTEGTVNTPGSISVTLLNQQKALSFLAAGHFAAMPTLLGPKELLAPLVLLDKKIGRFGPHDRGASFHQAQEETMIPTSLPCQFVDNVSLSTTNG
jgi:hypothetical protein